MQAVSIIGVDLAKQVFQLHGATMEGEIVFRKKQSRKRALRSCRPRRPSAQGRLCRNSASRHLYGERWGATLIRVPHFLRA